MFEKYLRKSDVLSKDAGHLQGRLFTLPHVFFKYFASKNQQPGFQVKYWSKMG